MSAQQGDPGAVRVAVAEQQRLVAFYAFHSRYRRAYLHYAELQLGDRRVAARVVHLVFLSLLKGWNRLMEEANPAANAWAHLKEAVDEVLILEDRPSALPETAAFAKVKRAIIEDARDEFAAMESSIGLYPAIARLPARQLDVVVLHYVLDYSTTRTAQVMGVDEATVRSHRLHARQRLAQDLGIELSADRNETC
ncbi:sigma-70 family RNA polymerase sigma factor [Streptomyces sp. WMMB303]|uniref:RNA polymerase sigma factor n=1 Tax=Streptomyces sp. WMMB303 TaxID=3034154 RepID=UPI0023ED4C54|nr:sigma-70 family RNA polymerase sigma factor [Streptomyces sp. WMMB303]MDF4254605.1 sigma-70 family RNA polymerase sigma factor [Streptomyces sp. WMMB303]